MPPFSFIIIIQAWHIYIEGEYCRWRMKEYCVQSSCWSLAYKQRLEEIGQLSFLPSAAAAKMTNSKRAASSANHRIRSCYKISFCHLAALLLLILIHQPVTGQSTFTCQSACPDNDVQSLSYGGNVTVTVLQAVNLPNKDNFGPFSRKSDPYVEVSKVKERKKGQVVAYFRWWWVRWWLALSPLLLYTTTGSSRCK